MAVTAKCAADAGATDAKVTAVCAAYAARYTTRHSLSSG